MIVNEHHQNAYGIMPLAAVPTQRVKRAKIGIVGNALPLHDDPLRVAEEIAMLDVISGGRIISGFVRGTGMEYFSYNINPTLSRERMDEAHDLIIQAWTRPGPFAFEGDRGDARLPGAQKPGDDGEGGYAILPREGHNHRARAR